MPASCGARALPRPALAIRCPTKMRIAEIFRSIQGEGRLTGVESVFVRASGCNLRCGYCDTPYASWTPEGDDLSVPEILDRIEQLRAGPPPAFLQTIKPRPVVAPQGPGATTGRGFVADDQMAENV